LYYQEEKIVRRNLSIWKGDIKRRKFNKGRGRGTRILLDKKKRKKWTRLGEKSLEGKLQGL